MEGQNVSGQIQQQHLVLQDNMRRASCRRNCFRTVFELLSVVFAGSAVLCMCSDNRFARSVGFISCLVFSTFCGSVVCFTENDFNNDNFLIGHVPDAER